MTSTCAHCSVFCSLSCANCKKVNYCSKKHQKMNRKIHKRDCFPARVEWSQNLGNHLIATRDIQPGETILEDEALVVGPRSNLPSSAQICLGCCNLVDEEMIYGCPDCGWSMCHSNCFKNPWHSEFECEILSKNNVKEPSNENELLFITILRCLLLRIKKPEVWSQFSQFEAHEDSRRRAFSSSLSVQSLDAVKFIQNTCGLKEFDAGTIDRIYGILIVNGFSDNSKYFVKLYSLASKISHSCISNTRSMPVVAGCSEISKLAIIATILIQKDEPLTQLYSSLLTGTFKRQECLRGIYQFTCFCARCQDPTEIGTNFSSVVCKNESCKRQILFALPENPLDGSGAWKCGNCGRKYSYESLVVPAIIQVADLTGLSASDPLYSEFEFYSHDSPDTPLRDEDSVVMKADYVIKMAETVENLGKTLVHPNHYSLLPVKTAIVATIYSIINKIRNSRKRCAMLEVFLTTVRNLIGLFDVLSPGMTRNRGIMLFYLASGLKILQEDTKRCSDSFANKNNKVSENEAEEIMMEARRILFLEPKSDTYRQFIEKLG